MKTLKSTLRRIRTSESGVSLIEVIVAMMIFAIISVGVSYSLLSAFTITNDSRSRAVATNLAAQEIDLDRSAADFFGLVSTTTPKLVQVPAGTGLTYSISRTVSLVYGSGGDVDCNSSSASSMLYKRIHVAITWPKMIGTAVVADTLLAPSTKISIDTLGTILVSTRTSAGAPLAGVTVAVSPNPGSTPTPTDSLGCGYVLKVPPGTYSVQVSKTGYIDPFQNQTPSKTVTVNAGQSTSAGFTLDKYGTVGWSYQSTSGAALPNNLVTSFMSTYGVYQTPATTPTTAQLYPSTEYDVVAGSYVPTTGPGTGCPSVNPAAWPSYTNTAGKTVAAAAPASVSFPPGPTGTVPAGTLGMGAITITNPTAQTTNLYVVATSAASFVSGDPGCTGAPQSITFGQILGKAKSSTVTIALPYGAWTLKIGTSATPTTAVASTSLSVPTGASGVTIASSGAFTFDPRVVQP